MAYVFVCADCGKTYYSAASYMNGIKNTCQSCGGRLVQIYPRPRLGEILVQLGYITEEELETALRIQRSISKMLPIGKIIMKLKPLHDDIITKAVKIQKKSMSFQKFHKEKIT